MGPTLDLPLSQADLLHILCDKDDLPDHEHESNEPHAFAEFTNVIHVASDTDEMKLLSSLGFRVLFRSDFPSRNCLLHCNNDDKSFCCEPEPSFFISSTVSISPLESSS